MGKKRRDLEFWEFMFFVFFRRGMGQKKKVLLFVCFIRTVWLLRK